MNVLIKSPSLVLQSAINEPRGSAVSIAAEGLRLSRLLTEHYVPCIEILSRGDGPRGRAVVELWGHNDGVCDFDVSPDGMRLLSASLDTTVRVWRWGLVQAILTMEGHCCPVKACAFVPSGPMAVSGGADGRLIVWHCRLGVALRTLCPSRSGPRGILCISACSAGNRLAVGGWDRRVHLFATENWTVESTLTGHSSEVRGCSFSPGGRSILVTGAGDCSIRTWSVGSDGVKPSGWPEESTAQELPDRVLCVDMSACHVACACGDGTVQLFVHRNGESDGEIHAHSGSALCCAFSPCGSFLATGGADCT